MKNLTISELKSELDEIIDWFSSNEVDIEKVEDKYSRGLKLANEIKKRLSETENKITKIKLDFEESN